MINNFKSVSHIIWMKVISVLGFLLARFSPFNCNCVWILDIARLMHEFMHELWTGTIYCIHVTVTFSPYFILHFGKPLLSGQPLLSSQLAHSRGWLLNRGLTVIDKICNKKIQVKKASLKSHVFSLLFKMIECGSQNALNIWLSNVLYWLN